MVVGLRDGGDRHDLVVVRLEGEHSTHLERIHEGLVLGVDDDVCASLDQAASAAQVSDASPFDVDPFNVTMSPGRVSASTVSTMGATTRGESKL